MYVHAYLMLLISLNMNGQQVLPHCDLIASANIFAYVSGKSLLCMLHTICYYRDHKKFTK